MAADRNIRPSHYFDANNLDHDNVESPDSRKGDICLTYLPLPRQNCVYPIQAGVRKILSPSWLP